MADLSYPSRRLGDRNELRAGDLVLDEARWTVHRGGRQVDLSPTEFRLLAYLMRKQGQVLTRAELLENVWGWDHAGQSQIVETYVSYLRRKLDALGPRLIHTRRGVGYMLRPAEAAASGASGASAAFAASAAGGPAGTGPDGAPVVAAVTASHRDEPARLPYSRMRRTAVR